MSRLVWNVSQTSHIKKGGIIMASIQTIDDGTSKKRYKVMYDVKTVSGIRKRKSKTFKPGVKKREAMEFKRQKEQEYEKSLGVLQIDITLSEFFDKYFIEYFKDTYSPTTLSNYKSAMYSSVLSLNSFFGKIPMSDITVPLVQEYAFKLQNQGLKSKTIRNRIRVLSALIEKAKKIKILEFNFENPTKYVELPQLEKAKIQVYTEEEMRELLKKSEEYDNFIVTLSVHLGLLAGLRRSEMAGLKEKDVDFQKNIIRIERARVYSGEKMQYAVKNPKTKAGFREIVCPTTLMQILRKAVTRLKTIELQYGKTDGFLLCYDNGKPCSLNNISSSYSRFIKKIGFRYLSLHKLRHSYASLCLYMTGDVKAVQESLGHSSAVMTLDIYGHAYEEKKKEQAENFA